MWKLAFALIFSGKKNIFSENKFDQPLKRNCIKGTLLGLNTMELKVMVIDHGETGLQQKCNIVLFSPISLMHGNFLALSDDNQSFFANLLGQISDKILGLI